VLEASDPFSEQQIRVPGRVHRVVRPSYVKERRIICDSLKFGWCVLQGGAILLRTRPDAVITTGPALAVPVSLVAKLLGVRIFFIETGSRIHRLSATGRIMRYLADLFFVQWEDLLPAAPRRARFAGRLF